MHQRYDARLASALAGNVEASGFFGVVAKSLLYDNLRSAVLEQRGSATRFQPRLLAPLERVVDALARSFSQRRPEQSFRASRFKERAPAPLRGE
jgi:hypothetical protein